MCLTLEEYPEFHSLQGGGLGALRIPGAGIPKGIIMYYRSCLIFICDMFLLEMNSVFVSCADGNTPYCLGKSPEELISKIERITQSYFKMVWKQWHEKKS